MYSPLQTAQPIHKHGLPAMNPLCTGYVKRYV